MKKRTISKTGAKKKAWNAFAKYIKAFYANQLGMCRCVTCGSMRPWNSPELHAGHFVGGRGNSVLFDEDIVRPQCARCNMFLGGEQARFALYLKREEGKTDEQIEELLNRRHKTVKYSTGDYISIAEEYLAKTEKVLNEKSI